MIGILITQNEKNMYIATKTFISNGCKFTKGEKHSISTFTTNLFKKGGYFDLVPKTTAVKTAKNTKGESK